MPRKPLTKPGKHGTLYRYRIAYEIDPGVWFTWSTWAYDADHAVDRWLETASDGYEDCQIKAPERVYQTI